MIERLNPVAIGDALEIPRQPLFARGDLRLRLQSELLVILGGKMRRKFSREDLRIVGVALAEKLSAIFTPALRRLRPARANLREALAAYNLAL